MRPSGSTTTYVVAVILVATTFGCKKPVEPGPLDGATATPPALLSVNSPTKDEDPSVLLASDGRLFVAWFSDRDANPGDIYVTSTSDRTTWSAPVRVTNGPGGDFYPNLLQDSHGTFHLVWFQWTSLFVGQIRHATSTNGTAWSAEEAVTTDALVDDWVPTIAEAPDGSLLVCFVASKRNPAVPNAQIYVVRKRPGQPWEPPVALSLNSATEHDHLPYIARTGPNELTMVWVRYAGNADFIANSRSDLYAATSSDGLSWSAPIRVTTDDHGQNLFPDLYRRHDGTWALVWLSTRSGAPAQYELPLSSLTRFPTGLVEYSLLPAGYSHRVTATPVPGEYLAAWVQGPEGAQDIYYRLIRR